LKNVMLNYSREDRFNNDLIFNFVKLKMFKNKSKTYLNFIYLCTQIRYVFNLIYLIIKSSISSKSDTFKEVFPGCNFRLQIDFGLFLLNGIYTIE